MGGLAMHGARSGGLHGRPVFSRCIFFLSRARGGGGGGGLFLQGAAAALFLLLRLERPVLLPASGLAANLVLCRHLAQREKNYRS